jgi:predicted  nucleic acid-binding Zn-ribbon protein
VYTAEQQKRISSNACRNYAGQPDSPRVKIKSDLRLMLHDIENLLKLQEADREIRRLQDEIAELPKRVAAIEQKLAGTKIQLEKAQSAIKADEAARRKHETAITDLRGKISKYRDQSLEVKTNEQYKALLHEIQFSEKEISANEDKILELMVNADAREKEVKAAQAELKAETAEIEKEKEQARERTAEDQKQLADWTGRRNQLRSGVNEELLRHYERVSKFRGSGIAEVRDQKCMGCQVRLRPQTYNDVRSSDKVVYCDSCQRVLYLNPAEELAAASEKPEVKHARRRHPKIDASQAWYYRPEFADAGEVYICLTNSGHEASRRVYEMHTGRQIGDILIREGEYRLAFPEDITGATRLNGNWSEEELDTWGSELPMVVLDSLQSDLEAARAEMRARSTAAPQPISPEHSAAS